MPKCQNCGQDFEGNFCPNCGAKVGEKPEASGEAPRSQTSVNAETDGFVKVYNALRFAPAALLALFAVLTFIFFATPVAVMSLGEGMADESLGNLYSIFDKEKGILVVLPDLQTPLIIAIVSAVVSLVCAGIAVKFSLRRYDRVVEKQLFENFGLSLSTIVSLICGLIAYIFAVVASLMITSKVSELGGSEGFLKAGTCPILIIVFAAVCFVLTVVLDEVRRYISKKNALCRRSDEEFLAIVDEYTKGLSAPEKPEVKISEKGMRRLKIEEINDETRASLRARGKKYFMVGIIFAVLAIGVGIAAGIYIGINGFDGSNGFSLFGYLNGSSILLIVAIWLLFASLGMFGNEVTKYFYSELAYDRHVKMFGEGKNYTGGKGFTEWYYNK